jgi:hypothetical protein
MSESEPNPQQTYALVVGIEKYDKCGDLDGAASNALKFVTWLCDKQVPNENIFLFISELNHNKSLVDACKIQAKKAISSNIFNAVFTEISKKNGDILYIFWSGHGYISDVENRRLLYSDDQKNFNLSSFLKSLKTGTFDGFNKQILFIDACANYNKSTSKVQFVGEKPYEETYPLGKPKHREQFALLAAKEGETAKYDSTEKIGLFSKVLMEELEKKNKLLLPEKMEEITIKVKNIFKEKYNNEQTPIYLWVREQDGSEETIGLTKSALPFIILEERWKELAPILSDISDDINNRCILYISCYFILSDFTQDVNGNYPEINSLKAEDSKRENITKILKNILFKQINNNEDSQPIFIVIKFICYLLMLINSERIEGKLKRWNSETVNEINKIGINAKEIKQEIIKKLTDYKEHYKKYHPYLIIVCKPKLSDSEKFYLSAELIFQIDNDEAKLKFPITNEDEVLLANIQDKFDDFLLFSYKAMSLYGFTKEQLIVEIFLPNRQLVEPSEKSYEKIEIKTDIYNGREWIGCHHKFVLRSFERLQNMHYTPLTTIKQKWDQLSSCKLNEKEIDHIFKWISCKEDCHVKSHSGILGINLLSYSGINIMDLLQKQVLREGLPLFIWITSIDIKQEQLREEFDSLLVVNDLHHILENIKNKRFEAYENKEKVKDSLGYHLGFLCDNPYRLPSSYDIIGDSVVDFGF